MAVTGEPLTGTAPGQAGLRPPALHARTDGPARTWLARIAGRWWVRAALLAMAAAVVFVLFLRLSWTQAANSDGAAQVLQAWDMLHGNPLLHGWTLSDTSFYTTELPQYLLLELLLGKSAAVIHVAAAMTYTLAVLLAAALAKGSATGRQAVIRMLVTAGIMVAPQPGLGVFTLLSSPDHIGTAVPLLATWLVVDRAGRRWWVPVVVGALLAWVLVADMTAAYLGIVPLVVACGVRAYRQIFVATQPPGADRFELALAAAALAAIPVAAAVIAVIHARHGYATAAVPSTFATAVQLPRHVTASFESVLLVFGANFLGLTAGLSAAAALVHLAGVALAAWGTALAIGGLVAGRRPQDLVVAVLAVAVVIDVTGYLFSSLSWGVFDAREIAVVLPYGAVLAGRILADRLIAARLVPVFGAVLAGSVIALAAGAAKPALATENQRVADWLVAHHLRYGVAGYWQASSITLASGGRAEVRQVRIAAGEIKRNRWESQPSWFDPRLHDAEFLVLGPGKPGTNRLGTVAQMSVYFGPAAHVYRVGPDIVLTYRANLLDDVH